MKIITTWNRAEGRGEGRSVPAVSGQERTAVGIMAGTIPSGEPPNYRGDPVLWIGRLCRRKGTGSARGMACNVAEEGYEHVYTYCASCAGN